MSEQKFEVGDNILVPMVVEGFTKYGDMKVRSHHIIPIRFATAPDWILPAMRDGEYRLTLDELVGLFNYADALQTMFRCSPKCYNATYGCMTTPEIVRDWLRELRRKRGGR